MRRFGTGLVYHLSQRHITCSRCGALWQERFVGVGTATGGSVGPLCPRCIPLPMTVDLVIEAEVTSTLSAAAGADPAEIRRTVAERYAEFLARRRAVKVPAAQKD